MQAAVNKKAKYTISKRSCCYNKLHQAFLLLFILAIHFVFFTPDSAQLHAKSNNKNVADIDKLLASLKILEAWRYSAILYDPISNNILYEKDSRARRYPASLTKIMTLYIAFEAIESGKLSADQAVIVSHRASAMRPSKIGLRTKQKVTVRDLIRGIAIKSANDAAVALAEAIAGSEASFVQLMNQKAIKLGMHNTHFANSSGWHNKKQYSTAYDMAILANAIRNHFPGYYHLFSKKCFNFKKRMICGHNHVLKRYKWSDGLKTGFVSASGFNIISTAVKGNRRLIAVVLGSDNAKMRDDHIIKLMNYGFFRLDDKKAFDTLDPLNLPINYFGDDYETGYPKEYKVTIASTPFDLLL